MKIDDILNLPKHKNIPENLKSLMRTVYAAGFKDGAETVSRVHKMVMEKTLENNNF